MADSKNIFVTGGAGYIGSHACKKLKNLGYTPITLDSLITGWEEAVKFGPFELVDLLDKKSLHKLFKKYKPSAVMHFAALSQVNESSQKPGDYWRNNVLGSLNLIEESILNECFKFVFSSTCATYGEQDNIVLQESSLQKPTNAYGASKKAIEDMLENFSNMSELRYVIFRYFNVAGADPDGEIGEFHQPETHLIPLVLDALAGKKEAIKIYGTDYDTFDGTCIRDYVHVCDLVDAHILGLDALGESKDNKVYNLGTGNGFSVRQIIDEAKKVTNQTVPQIESSRRPGDCSKLVSGSKLAKEELGWNPKFSSVEKMIKDAWKWHQTKGYSK
ncbi:UDP-glucose 4-epimerase GalE [Gammaproteobacteria bacterium]|nr:UDP-glucose 4-epimerase GalE [Gammaproteobacteria bacterium]